MDSGLYDRDAVDPADGSAIPVSAGTVEAETLDGHGDGDRHGTRSTQRPSIWRGLVLGLLATGAGLAAAELVVGLVRGSSSPVVPVGQEFIDVTPKWLKDWAIEQFGTNDKVVLVTGALVVVLGIGAIVGVLAVRGERFLASILTVGVGVLGAWAVLLRPAPDLGKLLPTIVGTVVSLAVLWWLSPRRVVPEAAAPGGSGASDGSHVSGGSRPRSVTMGPDRRQFVLGAVTVGSVAAVAGGVGRILQQRFEVDRDFTLPSVDGASDASDGVATASSVPVESTTALPDGVDLPVQGIESFVVPNDDFYRIDTALVVPQVSRDSWRLRIGGMVDEEIELSFQDLLDRPQIERYITLSCVSNPVGGDLVGNALWQGVLLRDVLEEAGVQPGAEQLVSRSVDDWTCGTPVSAVMDGRDAMLAIGMNGRPLPAQHGFPVRMVVPGLFGYVSATKWVTEMRLTRWEDFDAYWVPRGWSKEGPVKTMARIDTPRGGRGVSGEVPIGGVAWAVHRGVSAVQVCFDGGEWLDCELGAVPSDDTWRQWVYRWDTSSVEPGRHGVEVRAIDGDGEVQPEQPMAVAPNGAQGYHRIVLDV